VEANRLPFSLAARRAAEALNADATEWALHGGEDYQLLFTVPPERFKDVPPTLGPLGVVATLVGSIRPGENALAADMGAETPLTPRGFHHFR